jgi:hypothetical protein
MPQQPNTALALAQALHRYADMDEPSEVFNAVCADWPHDVAVLVNDYLFFECEDAEKAIATLQRNLTKLITFRAAYPKLKKARRLRPRKQ